MKKSAITRFLSAVFCLFLLSFASQAQQKVSMLNDVPATAIRGTAVDGIPGLLPEEDGSRAACDTFNLAAYRTTWNIRHYMVASPGWGAVNGYNSYADKAKANYFANSNANTYCFGGRFAFSRATALNINKTVTFCVWSVSGGKPGAVLGSLTVPMSELIYDVQNNYFTDIHFPTPVNTGGQPFFLGIDFSNLTVGDSLGLQSNFHGQTVPSAAFEKQADNLWYQYNTAGSWTLDISLAAFPFMSNVLPDANFTQSTTNTCSGYPVLFDASSSVQTALLFRFQGGTPATSNSLTPTVTWATAGTYTIKLYVLGGSCGALDSTESTITIIQSPNPAATASPSTICAGQSTTLSASNGTSYSWSGFTPGTNPVVATPGTTTTYTVTVTGSNGCQASQNVAVTVNPLPTVSSNSPTICAGQTATLIATGAASYTWSGLGTGNPVMAAPSSTTTYTVTGTTAAGCSNTATAVVTVNSLPVITVNSPSICSGQTATLTASGGTTYNWSGGLGTGNPVTTAPTSTTTYTVSGTASGCTGTNTSVVTVTAIPNVSITPSSSTICVGSSSTLIASGATSYAWSGGLGTSNPVTVSPIVTTTYTVTGTTSGCSGTAYTIISVNALPNVTATPATICSGQTATITASGASTYNWSSGGNTASTTVTPATTTTYTVSGTNSVGCTGTATAVVTVNATPVVTVNSPTICAGSTATLNASGASTYNWSGGLGTTATVTANPSSTTTYTVSGTSTGCTGTAASVVTVTPLPNVTVNSPTICPGLSATLTAAGATTYNWSDGLGTSNPVTVSPGVTTTYTVTGTSSGCSSTATSVVTVGSSLTISVNSPSICAGETATLTAGGATSYSWSDGLGASNPVTVSPSSTTTYTVTGTTSGCTGTATSVVTVNAIPSVTVNSPTICAGETATLTASGGTTYTWTGGLTGNPASASPSTTTTYTVSGTTSGCTGTASAVVTVTPLPNVTVNSPSICVGETATLTAAGATSYNWSGGLGTSNPLTVTPSFTTTYTVSGTDAGCTGTAVAVVTVNTAPTVIASGDSICEGQTATIFASGATSYNWSNGLGTNFMVTTPALSATTTYTVTGTTSGCSSSATAVVTVTPYPTTPVITDLGAGLLSSSAATGNQWYFNGSPIPGATAQTYQTTNAGSYYVLVTINGCTSNVSNIINTTAVDVNSLAGVSLYPNPTGGMLTIDPGTSLLTDVRLYNTLGELLLSQKISREGKVTLDLGMYAAGVYFLNVQSGEKSANFRIVKND